MTDTHYKDVIRFWFEELEPRQWWIKDAGLDNEIREKFEGLHQLASQEGLPGWRAKAPGALAEILVLDQFSRNIYRDRPESFASDAAALECAFNMIDKRQDGELPVEQRAFVYLPLMHSEDALVHEKAVSLFSQPGMESNLEFELKHKAIIDRFGRYPHRNIVLGRKSTKEEIEFLQGPDSSF